MYNITEVKRKTCKDLKHYIYINMFKCGNLREHKSALEIIPNIKGMIINLCNIPRPAINIDASVNAAFTADKLNAVKSYVDIMDC